MTNQRAARPATETRPAERRDLRVAADNVENLFDRRRPMNPEDRDSGGRILDAHGELTTLLQQATYGTARKRRIVELLTELGLARSDTAEFAVLRAIP